MHSAISRVGRGADCGGLLSRDQWLVESTPLLACRERELCVLAGTREAVSQRAVCILRRSSVSWVVVMFIMLYLA